MRKAAGRAALMLGLILLAAPLWAQQEEKEGYSYQQFSQAFRGYLELARGDSRETREGTLRLFQLGVELESPSLLKDATLGALRLMDYELVERIGRVWHREGGGAEALTMIAHVQVNRSGLESAAGTLLQLAQEGGPDEVYEVVNRITHGKIDAFIAAHPPALRGDDYYAYLALLHLLGRSWNSSNDALNAGLEKDSKSLRLLFVRLLLANALTAHLDSINSAEQLAEASGTDMRTTIGLVDTWGARNNSAAQQLPTIEDFKVPHEAESQYALRAGLFYLAHGDPGKALRELDNVQHNSPVWAETLRARVSAFRLLDDDARLLGMLKEEIDGIALEFLPEISVLYASELNRVDGPAAAYDYLAGITRSPDDPDILYNKSLYADRIDKVDVAEEALRRYIKIKPDDAYGYNALGYLFADRNYNLEEGLQLILRALKISDEEVQAAVRGNRNDIAKQIVSSSAAIVDSHGWILYRLGRLTDAREQLELSLKLMGSMPHAEVMAHYGEVLWELGERETAVDVWRQAWKVDSADRHLLKTLRRYGIERIE